MPIITQPPRDLVSAYRPIQFEVSTLGAPALLVPVSAVVTLFVEGIEKTTFRVSSNRNEPTANPLINDYFFCIDVSEKMRNCLAPFAALPSVFVLDCLAAPVLNGDSAKEFYFNVEYEYLDISTGLIVTFPVIETSNIFTATNITRQHLENMYLDEFLYIFPDLGRYLSNGPEVQNVCLDDSVFYSLLNDGPSFIGDATTIKVILYDSLGAIIGEALYLLPFPAGPFIPGTIHTINAGIEGLKCLTAFSQTPGYDLTNINIDCYTIEAGVSAAGYLQTRQAIKYKIDCQCCNNRRFRLHWLNCLGGVDSYTFCSIKELRQKSTAVIAEKALNWDKTSLTPNNTTDVGEFKTSSNIEQKYRIVSKSVTNKVAEWLKEVYSSVKVYAELETGVFVPVIIEDSDVLVNKETGRFRLELTIKLAYCIIKQSV